MAWIRSMVGMAAGLASRPSTKSRSMSTITSAVFISLSLARTMSPLTDAHLAPAVRRTPAGSRDSARRRRWKLSRPARDRRTRSDHDRMLEAVERDSHAALTQHGGNLSGNPGADTRHYGRALDEISPAPEQPEWSWAGPDGRLGSDS